MPVHLKVGVSAAGLNDASMSHSPTEGAVTAATTCSAGTPAVHRVHRPRPLRRLLHNYPGICVGMALPHSTPVYNVPDSTVRVTGDEPVPDQSKSSIRAHIPKCLIRECLKIYCEYRWVLPFIPSRLLELAPIIRLPARQSVVFRQCPDQTGPHGSLCLQHQEGDIQCVPLQV